MQKAEIKDLKKILEPVQEELNLLENRILEEISPASRALTTIVQEIFKAGGKRIRPALSFLFFRIANPEINIPKEDLEKIFLVAEISELIHTASLVHDDIIDNSLIRRGKATTNSKWDNAITVISGDFMFARAAVNLGRIGINEVTSLYAKVLEDLCDGEINQAEKKFSTELDWDYYYSKTYKKTASLFEASCKSPLIVLNSNPQQIQAAADYGNYLGMAFQLIDDILDFTSKQEVLGKAAFADLKDGQITLPVLELLEILESSQRAEFERVKELINKLAVSEDKQEKDFCAKEIFEYINEYKTIEQSLKKAEDYISKAKISLKAFDNSIFKNSLEDLADFVISRKF